MKCDIYEKTVIIISKLTFQDLKKDINLEVKDGYLIISAENKIK